jgi:hypothetical protein
MERKMQISKLKYMKKTITLLTGLFLSAIIYAQNIDTVYLKVLPLKYEEWSWIVGGINPQGLDSLNKKRFKKLIKFLDEANPAGNPTVITYDSLPGRFAMFAFQEYWANADAREWMGQGIDTKLRLYPALAAFIAAADAARLSKFLNRRNNGRDAIE